MPAASPESPAKNPPAKRSRKIPPVAVENPPENPVPESGKIPPAGLLTPVENLLPHEEVEIRLFIARISGATAPQLAVLAQQEAFALEETIIDDFTKESQLKVVLRLNRILEELVYRNTHIAKHGFA